MEALSETDRTIQANLGPELDQITGFDNAGIDLKQLEDLINGPALENFDAEVGGGYPHPMNGGGMDQCGLKVSPQRAPPAHQPPHLPYPHHLQQQQQQQLQQQQQHKNNQYCPQLPDSPPDSGSEPYSPPNGDHSTEHNQNALAYNVKTMTSMAQQMQPYMNHAPPHNSAHAPPMNSSHAPPMNHPPLTSSVSPPHTQSSPCSQASQMCNGPPQGPPGPQHAGPQHPGPQHPGPPHPGQHPHLAGVHMNAQLVHGRPPNYNAYNMMEPPKLNHPVPGITLNHPAALPGITLNPQMLPSVAQYNQMNNLANHAQKKRKYESPNGTVTAAVINGMTGMSPAGLLNIKSEPGIMNDCDDDSYPYDFCSEMGGSFMEGAYQVIKWQPFQTKTWGILLDHNYKELPSPSYRVDADKGFNFSVSDDAFVCQKKNHFQVTTHMEMHGRPKFIKTQEGQVQPIDSYHIHFYGVKMESHSQSIKIEQSQSDRSKKAFHPVRVDFTTEQLNKVTVGRLHFSETTTNNMRKKGKPNPDQRYFMLVVSLRARHCDNTEGQMIAAQVSERIIVRASNPGQFDQEVDAMWQKGHAPDSVFHPGRVGINTDRPDEHLAVHGNIKVTGHVIQPSDKRIKTDLKELDPKKQLENIANMKVYQYSFENEYADAMGKKENELKDTGVIAQEVREVLPDAVRELGDVELPSRTINNVLGVNKDRIYMENVGAVKELCKVTDKLETRINELEFMNKKLNKKSKLNARNGSIRSTDSTMSMSTCSTISQGGTLPRGFTTFDKELKDKDMKEKENLEKQDNPEKKKSHNHSHHRHRHHHHSHRHNSTPAPEESILCNNRFIQISIVVLVLVMAFCLVSITVLYILEKGESETPNPHHTPHPPISNPGNGSDTGNSTDPPLTPVPSGGPHLITPLPSPYVVPLNKPRCASDPGSCTTYCCFPPQAIHTTPRPPHDPCANGHDGDDCTTPGPTIAPNTPKHQPEVIDVHIHPLQDASDSKEHPNETPKENDGPQPLDPYDVIVDDGNPYQVLGDDGNAGRRKRAAPISNFTRKADLVIHELNSTLDEQYCSNNACREGLGSNFTYDVPLSPQFPTAYITVLFRLADNLALTLCRQFTQLECSQHEDLAGQHETHSWSLPIGYYAESYFKFRVADVDTVDVCALNDTAVGEQFADYWFRFHRLRDDTCADVPVLPDD